MWLFTIYGFYSSKVLKDVPTIIQVRARCKGHLLNLKKRFGKQFAVVQEARILRFPGADYLYRIEIPHRTWSSMVKIMVAEQDWDNFKNKAREATRGDFEGLDYVAALHEIWQTMYHFQVTTEEWNAPKATRKNKWEDNLGGFGPLSIRRYGR